MKGHWLRVVSTAFLLVSIIGFSSLASASEYVIKLGHIDPVTHPHNLACKEFAKLVKERTNGKVEVQVYPAGQIGNAPNLMEQLQMGTIQMFQGAIGWWGSTIRDYWTLAAPFVFKDMNQCLATMQGDIGKNVSEELLKKAGVRTLTQCLVRNTRNLLVKQPVKTLEDLNGLKIRVPEMTSWVLAWEALGANPTPVPLTETYLALQQSVVVGTEHGLPQLLLNNFTEVAKYVVYTKHQFETAGFFISEDYFSSLPDNYQKILVQSAKDAEKLNNKLQPDYLESAKKKMIEQEVIFIEIDNDPWYKVGRKALLEKVVPKVGMNRSILEQIWASE
ncbi:MAG: TRAP transporter substrate-binding protein [Deltaproteobacteria bacterium]|nr:TRAP transporter substrate-binding protein [Deltaproteobacteria bacterium]